MSTMLSKNFSVAELTCQCGCGMVPTAEFISRLQALRDAWGSPLKVTSAARCKKHNAAVGGAPASKHVDGIAADITCTNGGERYKLLRLAYHLGFTGLGLHPQFLHLDIRPAAEAVTWFYFNLPQDSTAGHP